jgi:hypothetical protein
MVALNNKVCLSVGIRLKIGSICSAKSPKSVNSLSASSKTYNEQNRIVTALQQTPCTSESATTRTNPLTLDHSKRKTKNVLWIE